jgi:hypothetical protein
MRLAVCRVLAPDGFHQREAVRRSGVAFEAGAQMRPCVGDERLRDERDRRCRAFDVEQDHRTYAGPKQTGSNPLSTPLSV